MMAAFVLIQITTTVGNMQDLHQALHAVAGVKTVHFLIGPTDAIAFVEVADQAALAQTLGKIRAVHGIANTDTRLVWSL